MDFKQPYNRDEFVSFLSSFLPDDFERTEENIKLTDISFNPDKIKKIKLIGSVSSLENLRVYEIYHESENDPRVTLSKETFRLMSNYGVKKALAVFISKNSLNYRFSLATIDLKFEGSRVTKEYSNPRRYSFYLGPDAKVHTPKEFLIKKGKIKDLKDLQSRFSIEVVTKAFFAELSNWYFWALKYVVFPRDAEKEENGKNIAVIRLITRLIFIWFMKQKGLIPDYLFDENKIENILNDLSFNESTYYKAVLQNLFFATLNTRIKDRKFRFKITGWKNSSYMNHTVYRYENYFKKKDNMLEIFKDIPFLNGGLFECLDERIEEDGKIKEIRRDGFSDRENDSICVPNFLFFQDEKEINLNKDYGTKGKLYKVRGIINLLQMYNFTIDESTPVDVDIALDPELLGRVFENLLASYNPETATTARKATGSYYTPREIVDYMVAESLKEYFKTHLKDVADFDDKIASILSYDTEGNPFNDAETNTLISLTNKLKIIDPAVGSGAFPMGTLHKLVLVLSKLDPHNKKWKQQQIDAIERNITDAVLKRELVEKVELDFQRNELDYGRKLYLIQNCIYGVDIQPIATQIAKLRFFISLLVDEKMDKSQGNYGIEPLPNLETKFVSANSLIGLEKQKQLLFKDPRVETLEEELKRIRDQHFSASYSKEKEKLRKRDKDIRQKLELLLKQNNYSTENTEKIVEWDPYNSNKSAGWFDPEWMFGVKYGFDIAIANPPYGFRNVLTKKEKSFFRKEKGIQFPSGNVAELFVIITLRKLVRDTGILTFIIPKKSLYGESWRNVRKIWLDYGLMYLMDASKAFEKVLLEQISFSIVKINNKKDKISIGGLNQVDNRIDVFGDFSIHDIFSNDLRNAQIYKGLFPNSLINRIKNNALLNTQELIKGEIGISNITKYLTLESKDNYPCVKGIDIARYGLKPQYRYIKGGIAKKYLSQYQDDKIVAQEIIAHIKRPFPHILITMFYDEANRLINDTCVEIKVLDKRLDKKFMLAYLQSTFCNWYAYNFIYNRAIRTMHFIDYYITQIPIPNRVLIEQESQKPFNTLVDKILLIAKDNDYLSNPAKQSKVREYERQIDLMVYKLYDLTYDEVEIVDPEFELRKNEYEKYKID